MVTDVFVFGSNLAGRHGKGAAKAALDLHGAVRGQGEGMQGSSYAIPTKDAKLKVLPLEEIRLHVFDFVSFAELHPELTFNVTKIGCGLAGYTPEEIAPLFPDWVLDLKNVKLPGEFSDILSKRNDEDWEVFISNNDDDDDFTRILMGRT